MGYLKRFYEEHHFEEMVPYEPAEMEESISPFANKLAAATISRDKTRALIYYGEMDGMSTPLAGLATESMQFPGLIRERDRQKKQKSRWKCVESRALCQRNRRREIGC